MKVVNLKTAAAQLGISYSMAGALKKAARIQGYYFELEKMEAWWKANPGFRFSDAYPPKGQKPASLSRLYHVFDVSL